MQEGYNEGSNGIHVFYNEATQEKVTIDTFINRGFYEKEGVEMREGELKSENATGLVEFMRIPGTGLGMVLIKLGEMFRNAVGAGSDAN